MAEQRRRGNGANKPGSSGARSKANGSRSKSASSGSKSGNSRKKSSSTRAKSSGTRSKSSGSRSSAGGEQDKGQSQDSIRGTAPSAADITKLELMEPSEEAKAHEPSKVDAMGQDKRREVVGHSYGPSRRSQLLFFVAAGVIVVVVLGGWLSLVAVFDKAPTHFNDKAPWSTTAATPELVSEQSTKPRPPTTPCGEPGNEYPVPEASPCAPPNKANAFK